MVVSLCRWSVEHLILPFWKSVFLFIQKLRLMDIFKLSSEISRREGKTKSRRTNKFRLFALAAHICREKIDSVKICFWKKKVNHLE